MLQQNAAGDAPPALATISKRDAASTDLEERVIVTKTPRLVCECGSPLTAGWVLHNTDLVIILKLDDEKNILAGIIV